MNIVVESSCNQRCDFCFAHEILGQNRTPSRMPLSEVEFLISFLGHQPRQVNILGGEPTLHPQLPQIIKLFHDAGHRVTLITNGLGTESTIAQCLPYLGSALVNYRSPDAYNANQSEQMAATMALLTAHREARQDTQWPFAIDLAVTFTQVGQNYDYLLSAARDLAPRSIRWDLSKPSMNHKNQWLDPFDSEQTGDWIVTFVEDLDAAGVLTSIDCPLPMCIFSDTQLRFLERKVQRFRGRCNPPMDILPGLSAIHCFPLAGVCEPVQLTEVGTYDNLFRFISGVVRKGVMNAGLMEKCRQCHWHTSGKCQGYCPAARVKKVH